MVSCDHKSIEKVVKGHETPKRIKTVEFLQLFMWERLSSKLLIKSKNYLINYCNYR